jgi:hypothetical protein
VTNLGVPLERRDVSWTSSSRHIYRFGFCFLHEYKEERDEYQKQNQELMHLIITTILISERQWRAMEGQWQKIQTSVYRVIYG